MFALFCLYLVAKSIAAMFLGLDSTCLEALSKAGHVLGCVSKAEAAVWHGAAFFKKARHLLSLQETAPSHEHASSL